MELYCVGLCDAVENCVKEEDHEKNRSRRETICVELIESTLGDVVIVEERRTK